MNGTRERRGLQFLGPGLITGASDDDPSGIGTYSQAGAQFGYGLLWTLLFSYPLMVGIQEISARIGRTTGRGIAGNLQHHQAPWLARTLVGVLAVANVINLGADLGAMGAALKLLLAGPQLAYVCGFGVACALLEIFVGYQRYAQLLKWLCLSLLSYVVCALVSTVSWRDVALALIRPQLLHQPGYAMAVVAILGTTISPYLFFWQAQEEVEDHHAQPGGRRLRQGREASAEFSRIHLDTLLGMAISNLIAICIVITTAAALHAHGQLSIDTATQAAAALHRVAGPLTFVVFALGIVGTGLLAVPVLAGSAAYAVGEIMSWRVGLAQAPRRARSFYGAIALATAVGCGLNFTSLNPMRALYWSAVLNGIAAAPVMAAMMLLSTRREVMGALTLPTWLRVLGWAATATMAAAALALLLTWITGRG
jgi:NRAMP (natural resistance-associated macrophage protein)-like metal ion transporter